MIQLIPFLPQTQPGKWRRKFRLVPRAAFKCLGAAYSAPAMEVVTNTLGQTRVLDFVFCPVKYSIATIFTLYLAARRGQQVNNFPRMVFMKISIWLNQ